MSLLPSVAVVSSSNTKPTSLIKLITKNTSVSDDLSKSGIVTEEWKINTKYYTTNVHLSALHSTYQRSEEFNASIEALVILFDSNKETGLTDLRAWESIEEDCDPDVKLLISNYCTSETKITKSKAIDWCLKRGFELIELYPPPPRTDDSDEEDIIKETTGIDRIVEALETHLWSNLQMKSISKPTTNAENSLGNDLSAKESGIDTVLDNFLLEDNADFTDLFSQLHMMKESVQSLPVAERRQCAEQVVKAFWKAVGGDDEEISELQ